MGKTYRPYYPDEELLLPPSLRDWLPENHLAYFVSDVVDNLELSAMDAVYGDEKRGQPPYDPLMMTKVLVYAYCVGVFSSRKIERRLVEDNASKHKAMSYDRMLEKEKQLKAEVKQLLEQAETADAQEDARYGKDRTGDELPPELERRETRLKKIQQAKRALQERARQQAVAEGSDAKQAKPKDKDQYNFTDPESRIMKGPDGFVQAYNAQAAVEPDLQLIVGQTVTQATNDKQQLLPMVEVIEQQSGQRPEEVLADSGYCSEKNLEALESAEKPQQRIEGYIATERQKHDEYREPCPKGPLPKGATRVDRMRRKLKTKAGKAVYAARKAIVEPVFGQIKHARGFRQFRLRGIEKIRGEWSLVCLTHNILKCYRLCYE
jgi:transposase